MKSTSNFIFIFFILITINSFSQTQINLNKIIYLDSTWAETTADNYKYIRIIQDYYLPKKSYLIRDYYKSDTLQMIGNSLDKDIIKEDGQFIYYYENGKRKSVATYFNRKRNGKEFNWYENGNINSELEYFEDKEGKDYYKITNYWNIEREQKVKAGNGEYEKKNENFEESGKVKDGFRDGVWKGKDFKNKFSFIENYENGKLVSGVSTDYQNINYNYNVVNQFPKPKKGIESFYSYIGKSVQIPLEDRNKVFGTLFITFFVDREGNLVEPKIIKGLTKGIDKSVIYAITHAKKWKPGILRGIPVRVLYSIPITLTK